MSTFSLKLRTVTKKAAAWSLAALTAITCVGSLPAVTTQADAAGILSDSERGVLFANSRSDFRDESIYFLITTRFNDGDPSNNARTSEDEKAKNPASDPSWRGDFKGLIDKLDYIKALGFTAIWITPVVTNWSGYDYHGYHAYDFSAVDTRYESNGVTYQTLIDAVHAKGMKIIQDVVVNHTCNMGEKNLLKIGHETDYPARTKVVMNGTGDPENIYHHNGFCGGGDWDNYEAQDRSIHSDCFDLETENPKVFNYLNDCYTKYIKMGVDGFRIDTVKHVSRLTFNAAFLPAWKAAGGDDFYMFGEICTKGHDVWYREHPPISTCFYTWADDSTWLGKWSNTSLDTNESLVKQHYTDHNNPGSQPTSTNAFLNGNEYHTPDYSKRSGMDAIDFQMHWSFNDANSAFNTALGEDKYFNDSTWNVVYVDSHDYAPDQNQNQRYTGGTNKWAENLSLMFTFRGIPCIFYGSEIEFQAGMPIDKGPDAPLSATGRAYYGDKIAGNVTSTDFTVFGNVSGEVGNTLNATLSQHIMRLNRIRQAIPALRKGQYSREGCTGGMSFKRRYTDSNTDSFVCVTISGGATFSGIPNGTYVDAVTGDTQNVTGGTLTANCSGQGNMRVYVLSTSKTPAPGRVIPNGDFLTDGGAAVKIGPVPVNIVDETSVTVSPEKVTVLEAETASVTATVGPSNATYKSVTWESSNPSVATVDASGTIKGISVGTATVTATTTHKKLKATVSVTVKPNLSIVKPTGVTVSPSTLTVTAGNTGSLTATVKPDNATDKSVTWKSSNDSIATVDASGTVKGVAAGTATITATTSNGLTASASVKVEGPKMPYIEGGGVYFMKPEGWGDNINIYLYDSSTDSTVGAAWPGTSMKKDASGIYLYEYKTTSNTLMIVFNDGSNQAPATNGYKYVDQGVYDNTGYKYTMKKPDDPIEVTSVSLSSTSATVKVGSTTSLTATVEPANATDKTLTWTSSNPSVASVSSSGVVKGESAGTATITVRSSNGKTATATIKVEGVVVDELINTSTISSKSITQGSSVTVKGSATGGKPGYKYSVLYKKQSDSTWSTKQAYSTNASVSITLNTVTTYNICIKVKDTAGTEAKMYYDVKVVKKPSTLTNTSTISAKEISLGKSVTIKGSATGGRGTYKYAVYYKKTSDSKWATSQDFKTNASVTVKPGKVAKYDVCVKVKDSAGNVEKNYFTVKVTKAILVNSSKLSASAITFGNTVTINGAATGGTGTYKYAVYYKKSSDTKWATMQDFKTTSKLTLKPEKAVKYDVCVKVKDGSGSIEKKYLTVTVTKPLTGTSKLSSKTITLGGSVNALCSATGGSGYYNYAVYYKRSSSSEWTTLQNFTGNDTVKITPKAVTTYDVCIKAVDSKKVQVKQYFTLKVNAELTNTSKISSTTPTVGTAITITGSATGGSGSYKYAFFYKKATDTEWVTVQDFNTNAKVSVKPARVSKYEFCVKVKDSSGTISKKYFNTKTVGSLVNNSKLSSLKIVKGNTVTVTGAASGGTGSYKYAVYYKKTSETTWASAQDYNTTTKVIIKPGKVTKYDVCVKVKDGSGKEEKKYYVVTVVEPLTNSSKVSASSVTLGGSVTITAAAVGGSGSYKYAVYYKKASDSEWATKQDYSTNTKLTFKPGKPVKYDVCVKVIDSSKTVVKKYMTVTAVDPATVINNSTISAATVSKGGSLTVTCAAKGGRAPYKYLVDILKAGDSTWTTVQAYTTNTSIKVKFASTGSYQVRVTAKDSAGSKTAKYFSVTSK